LAGVDSLRKCMQVAAPSDLQVVVWGCQQPYWLSGLECDDKFIAEPDFPDDWKAGFQRDVSDHLWFWHFGRIAAQFRVALQHGSLCLPIAGIPLYIFHDYYDHPGRVWVHFRQAVTGGLVLQRSDGGAAFRDVAAAHVHDCQHVLFDIAQPD